jgi:hypothetical protein
VNNATFDICYKAILEINKKNMVTFWLEFIDDLDCINISIKKQLQELES